MGEQNERIAVLETKIVKMQEQLEHVSDMHLTLDALVRQARRHSEMIDGDEFLKDRIWLREARESSEKIAGKIKLTAAGILTAATLSGLWYGFLQYVWRQQ